MKRSKGEHVIIAEFIQFCEMNKCGNSQIFIDELHRKWGFDPELIAKTVAPFEKKWQVS